MKETFDLVGVVTAVVACSKQIRNGDAEALGGPLANKLAISRCQVFTFDSIKLDAN